MSDVPFAGQRGRESESGDTVGPSIRHANQENRRWCRAHKTAICQTLFEHDHVMILIYTLFYSPTLLLGSFGPVSQHKREFCWKSELSNSAPWLLSIYKVANFYWECFRKFERKRNPFLRSFICSQVTCDIVRCRLILMLYLNHTYVVLSVQFEQFKAWRLYRLRFIVIQWLHALLKLLVYFRNFNKKPKNTSNHTWANRFSTKF